MLVYLFQLLTSVMLENILSEVFQILLPSINILRWTGLNLTFQI